LVEAVQVAAGVNFKDFVREIVDQFPHGYQELVHVFYYNDVEFWNLFYANICKQSLLSLHVTTLLSLTWSCIHTLHMESL
jgi:hypothetical protein